MPSIVNKDARSLEQVFQDALQHQQAGRHEAAERDYRTVLSAVPDYPPALHFLGLLLAEKGDAPGGLPLLRRALQLDSAVPEFHNNLGVILEQTGDREAAETCYREATRLRSDYVEALNNLGNALLAREEEEEAEQCYRAALGWQPGYFKAACGLANTHMARGQWEEAEACFRDALRMRPAFAPAGEGLQRALAARSHDWNARGCVHQEEKDDGQAESCFRKAIELDPACYDAHANLGSVLSGRKHYEAAIAAFRQAITVEPERPEAWRMLGDALRMNVVRRLDEKLVEIGTAQHDATTRAMEEKQARLEALPGYAEAEAAYREALSRAPDSYETLVNYALLLQESLVRPQEAERLLRRAMELAPERALAPYNLGFILLAERRDEALGLFRQAMRYEPRNEEIYLGIGAALRARGLVAEMIAFLEETLERDKLNHRLHSYLIWNLDSTPWVKLERQQGERKRWDTLQVKARGIVAEQVFSNGREPERRLRVGLFSGEFYDNSAPNGFGPFLLHHDRGQFEVICYDNSPRHDAMTERLKAAAAGWREIDRMSDEEAAACVREDGIDILIDNSGHSYSTNRLLMFARKPAPIQITAWGYPSGTGLEAMDYLFQDEISVPPEECALYAEKVIYLPCVISYLCRDDAPPVGPLPALKNRHITYGCFNAPHKISDEVLAIWAELLRAQPDARLILKYSGMDEALQAGRILTAFSRQGVAPARLTLLGGSPWYRHLEMYRHVDLALDAFPYGGGVTTLDALWMGVPVVGFRWDFIGGRNSASILTAAGLPEWVTTSPQAYLAMAMERSRDLPALAALRQDLRQRLRLSRLANPDIYVRRVEEILRGLWRERCGKPPMAG